MATSSSTYTAVRDHIDGHPSDGELLDRLRTLWRHGSLFVGVVAVGKGLVALAMLSVPADPILFAIAFLAAVTIYTHNHVTDLEEDAINSPDQAAVAASRRGLLVAFAGTTYLVALGLALLGGVVAVGITLFPGLAALLYGQDWLPVTAVDRLKDVAVVNTTVVAAAWAVPLAYLPFAFTSQAAGVGALAVAGFLFLRTFAASEVMNVRDVAGDRAADITTLPVLFGVRTTTTVLYVIDAVSVALVGWSAAVGIVPATVAAALLPAFAYSLWVTTALRTGGDPDRLAVAKDGEYLLMAASVLAVTALG